MFSPIRIAKGIAYDQHQRRRAMAILLSASLFLLGAGIFPLWNFFPTHPLFFAIYWLVCAWLTICVLLLAIYDLLMVIRRAREERTAARGKFFDDPD